MPLSCNVYVPAWYTVCVVRNSNHAVQAINQWSGGVIQPDPNASCPVLYWKDPEQMGRVPPADRVCATLHVQSIAARGIPNRLMLGRETSYTPYLTQRLGPGGGGGTHT